MQTLLNHSVEAIAVLYCLYLVVSTLRFYFHGDRSMSDESLMRRFIELERRKRAIRARVPKQE